MSMRYVLAAVVLALAVLAPPSANGGQTKIQSYADARDKFFWKELYAAGGVTIYCGQPFTRKLGLEVEHIYPASWMVDHLHCGSRSQCRADPTVGTDFNHMEADLHNLYPARCGTNRSRSNMLFGLVNGEPRDFGLDCDFEVDTDAKVAEPPAVSRPSARRPSRAAISVRNRTRRPKRPQGD